MTTKPRRPYRSTNVKPDDHDRLARLALRFSGEDPERRPVSLPDTIRKLLDYYETNEGIKI